MLNASKLILNLIYILGSISATKILLSALCLVKRMVLATETNYSEYGSVELSKARAQRAWAVVTGASAGIGREFALQLAQKGFNILAIARSVDKLEELSQEIKKVTNCKITGETYIFDLKTKDSEKWESLYKKLESLPGDIGVLVNNAGVNQEYPEEFKKVDEEVIQSIIDLNITGTVKLTKKVLPLLLSPSEICEKRLIVNIGSIAGEFPTPLLSTYSGSKAFISTWSQALTSELRNTKIHVEVLIPSFVSTEMSKIKKANAMVPKPKTYVKSVLSSLGTHSHHFPYMPHAVMAGFLKLLPTKMLVSYVHSVNAQTKKAALRKLKKN